MSKSLWGASATTEPTPFDEITPVMLEGVGNVPEPPARYEMQDRTSPADAVILERLTKLTREHWAWKGEPVRMLAATDPPTLRDITADELETMGLRLRTSQPEPPPTGNGELVTPPLVEALEGHPDLQALVNERDAFGRSKYGTGLRCHNGRDPLEDARQELGDLLQYLWQAMMEGRDITSALDQMARALSVLQERKR